MGDPLCAVAFIMVCLQFQKQAYHLLLKVELLDQSWQRTLWKIGIVDFAIFIPKVSSTWNAASLVAECTSLDKKKLPMLSREICALGKTHGRAAPKRIQHLQLKKDTVYHADRAGCFQRSIHGNQYYMAIKWMGYTHLYFLRNSEAVTFLREYLNVIK